MGGYRAGRPLLDFLLLLLSAYKKCDIYSITITFTRNYTGSKTDFSAWFTANTLVAGDYSGGGGSALTVSVAPTTATVAPAGTQQLTATASDNTATITYASNNAKVTVSDTGLVTVAADAEGTATITITATKGGSTATATSVITVGN